MRGRTSPRVDDLELHRYRDIDAHDVLMLVAQHVKEDNDYRPQKDARSRRWQVTVDGKEFEILTTGPKWFDTRRRCGGGGAIDLVRHLLGCDFLSAVAILRKST